MQRRDVYDPSATDPYASPGMTWEQRDCDLRGGYWNRNAGVCESPLFGW